MELIRKQVMHDSGHFSTHCTFYKQLHSKIKHPPPNHKKQIESEKEIEFIHAFHVNTLVNSTRDVVQYVQCPLDDSTRALKTKILCGQLWDNAITR